MTTVGSVPLPDLGPRTLEKIERWDPVSFIFLVHGLGMAAAGETAAPLAISLLTGALALVRLAMGWLMRATPATLLTRAVLSFILVLTVVVLDGGTDSPFFFWVVLLLVWQGLTIDRQSLRTVGIVAFLGCLAAVAISGEFNAAALFRCGLLAALIVVILLGRWTLEKREADVTRLDDVLQGLVEEVPVALAVLDADRDTLLYANESARRMGITSRDEMARLVLYDPRPQRVRTLAELVVGAPFQPSPMRLYRSIGNPAAEYQIGFEPRRADTAAPVVMIYALPAGRETE